jgi:hypothetical protein
MSQTDLWRMVAECERAIEATTDPLRREVLTRLRELWTNLANESPFLGDKLTEEIERITRIHADLMPTTTNKVTSTPGLHPPP